MIAFGTFVAEDEAYRRYAEPGIARAAEPDSAILAYASVTSLPRSLNIILDAAARHDDLEALVLLHPHTEITDPALCARVRDVLADPDVGVAGAAGARGGNGLAWWEGAVSAAPGTLHYDGYGGGGEFPAFGWAGPSAPLGEVDVVDGSLMVLSPWAVRTVRFDEGLRVGYGFDTDFCRQVRAARPQGRDRRPARRLPPRAGAGRGPRPLDRGPPAGRGEVGGRARRGSVEGAGPPGRGRAGGRARDRPLAAGSRSTRGSTRWSAGCARRPAPPRWRITEPLRRANARRRRLSERSG